MMDPRTGLLPGQSWSVTPGGAWQARLCRAGRAHVIGLWLAGHPEYGIRYREPLQYARKKYRDGAFREYRPRPWHTFERACQSAAYHERMVIAAKRQEQGGDA